MILKAKADCTSAGWTRLFLRRTEKEGLVTPKEFFIDRTTNERWEELKEESHGMSGFGKA